MRVLRPLISVITALAFFLQVTGLAYAQSPPGDVQPVPYAPAQPVPVPGGGVQVAPAPQPQGVAPAGIGPDAVYLKGGGMMRGTLIEMLPNDHATIQLPTGQNAIIEWGKIDHIERAAPAAVRPPVMMPGLAPPVVAVAPRGSAFVHLDTDQGLVLESIAPGTGRWAMVCAAPCDAQLPIGREYRISGEGVRPSRPFGLGAAPGQRVIITASGASRGAFAGGVALTTVGTAAVIIGLVVLLVGAAGTCDAFSGVCTGSSSGAETAGAVISIAGAAAMVGGIILMASNARTRTTQIVAQALPPAPDRPQTAWLRAPIWHESPRESASGLPKTVGIPLLSHSF